MNPPQEGRKWKRPHNIAFEVKDSRADWTNEDWDDQQAQFDRATHRMLWWQVAVFASGMVLMLFALGFRLLS